MRTANSGSTLALWIAIALTAVVHAPHPASADETLLSYSILQGQFVQAGQTVSLDILVSPKLATAASTPPPGPGRSRPTGKAGVQVKEIEIVMGHTGGSTDLTGTPEGIVRKVRKPDPADPNRFIEAGEWAFTHPNADTGRFLAQPDSVKVSEGKIIFDSQSVLLLTLSDIPVSSSGTAYVTITETASSVRFTEDDSGKREVASVTASEAPRSVTKHLAKFSAYTLSDLVPTQGYIEYGGTATVLWHGGRDASYRLAWDRASKVQEPFPVSHEGPYTISGPDKQPTKIYETVNFTLYAKRDNEPERTRTARVVVIPPEPKLNKLEATWQQDGKLRLEWDTEHYSKVFFSPAPPGLDAENKGSYSWVPASLPLRFILRGELPGSDESGRARVVDVGTLDGIWKASGGSKPLGKVIPLKGFGLSADGRRIAVASEYLNEVRILDSSRLEELPGSPIKVSAPYQESQRTIETVALSHDGRTLFVSHANVNDQKKSEIRAVDLETNSVKPERIAVGISQSMAASPIGGQLFAITSGYQEKSKLTVLDTRTMRHAPGSPHEIDGTWQYLAVSPDGLRLLATDLNQGRLHILRTRDLKPARQPVPVGNSPSQLAFSPDGKRVYIINYEWNKPGSLTVLDTSTWSPVDGSPKKVGNGAGGVHVSPDGLRVFVTNRNDNNLMIFDAQTLQELPGSPLAVGQRPIAISVAPNAARALLITQTGDGQILEQVFSRSKP